MSISGKQKKPVKCFLFIFSNWEANNLASVSFVQFGKNSVKERYFSLSIWLLDHFDIANIVRKI